MEREAAEGQEVEPSGLGPSHTSPLPLEQLLALSEQSGNKCSDMRYIGPPFEHTCMNEHTYMRPDRWTDKGICRGYFVPKNFPSRYSHLFISQLPHTCF